MTSVEIFVCLYRSSGCELFLILYSLHRATVGVCITTCSRCAADGCLSGEEAVAAGVGVHAVQGRVLGATHVCQEQLLSAVARAGYSVRAGG